MLNQKMNAVISEVCEGLAERNELVHTIALALLTGKNLFVLGKPGRQNPRLSTCSEPISAAQNNSISS